MIKQIVNTFFTRTFSGLFNLIVAIILSNYLGADGKGIQSLLLATISLFIMFGGVVGYGGLTFLLPRFSFSILVIPSYLWSLFSIIVCGIMVWYFGLVQFEYISHVMILSFINSIASINNSILHSNQKIKEVNQVNIFQNILTLSVIIYLVIKNRSFSVSDYLIALYISYSGSLLLSYFYAYKSYLSINFNEEIRDYLLVIKNHFKYGGSNQLDLLAQFLTFRFAYYVLNFNIDSSQVGIYSNAVSIIESVWIVSRSISYVQHSVIVNSTDDRYNSNLTLKFIKLSGFIALLAILTFLFIPSNFYQFLFGDEFADMRLAILALSPGILFFSISFIISSYFSGTGRHYINSISSIVGLLAIIISSLYLIPVFGIIGAGLSSSFSYLITTLIKVVSFSKITKISINQLIPKKEDLLELIRVFKSKN